MKDQIYFISLINKAKKSYLMKCTKYNIVSCFTQHIHDSDIPVIGTTKKKNLNYKEKDTKANLTL